MAVAQKDVEIGGVYEVRWHDGSLTEVEILRAHGFPIKTYDYRKGYPAYSTIGRKTRYSARNLATGRVVTIKSAAKLRRRIR